MNLVILYNYTRERTCLGIGIGSAFLIKPSATEKDQEERMPAGLLMVQTTRKGKEDMML
jgi:hypothetical protein